MREILKEEIINIPEGVTIIKKKNREFIVKGPYKVSYTNPLSTSALMQYSAKTRRHNASTN